MKFEFKASKRAIPYLVEAIENNLNSMPFATRLYFQKFEEIMSKQLRSLLEEPSVTAATAAASIRLVGVAVTTLFSFERVAAPT